MFTPRNELGVIVKFAKEGTRGNWETLDIQVTFPDAVVKHNGRTYKAEFEYKASNFIVHNHDPRLCDLVICWENDCPELVLPVLELRKEQWWETIIDKVEDELKDRAAGNLRDKPKREIERKPRETILRQRLKSAKQRVEVLETEIITGRKPKRKRSRRITRGRSMKGAKPKEITSTPYLIRIKYSDCLHFNWCKENIGLGCQGCNRYEPKRESNKDA